MTGQAVAPRREDFPCVRNEQAVVTPSGGESNNRVDELGAKELDGTGNQRVLLVPWVAVVESHLGPEVVLSDGQDPRHPGTLHSPRSRSRSH